MKIKYRRYYQFSYKEDCKIETGMTQKKIGQVMA